MFASIDNSVSTRDGQNCPLFEPDSRHTLEERVGTGLCGTVLARLNATDLTRPPRSCKKRSSVMQAGGLTGSDAPPPGRQAYEKYHGG